MSKLAVSPAEDHPEAAHKNLGDAQALYASGRPDGAAYLSGYVVECSLKSLWLLESGVPSGRSHWKQRGARPGAAHDLNFLHSSISNLASIAGAKSAKYLKAKTRGLPSSSIINWSPEMRYSPPAITMADARTWVQSADDIYNEIIAEMRIDGVL